MRKSPKKPTGIIGPLHITSQGTKFEKIDFSSSKEEIEEFIVQSFLKNNTNMPLQIEKYEQNLQDDFDFTIKTTVGNKFLELMEIAPLENLRGSYENAPSSYKPYDFADYIFSKITRKSERYLGVSSSGICLLLYITHWTFSLSQTIIALLQYWSLHRSHCFEYIFCYSPVNKESGITYLIYPTPPEFWKSFNPDDYRENIVHNQSPLEW